ncbi:MAG TPA: hypothetical protein VNG13_15125 [Mycobacteriales bacterium]|nr:hypothetical protein [Mycobacteriales bacterium]
MAGFVQIIEFTTSRIDEVDTLMSERRADLEAGTAVRSMATGDRDRAGTYLSIVEFPSYEAAMANSERPETRSFAEAMGKLCDGPPKFYNLDVRATLTGD